MRGRLRFANYSHWTRHTIGLGKRSANTLSRKLPMEETTPATVTNFGRNVVFQPRHHYAPRDEAEILAILNRHAKGKIRVMGSRHSWSDAIVSDDVLIDMQHFQQVQIERNPHGEVMAIVGGGCPIKHALAELLRQANVTLPA